jgi:hypothetical protein
MGGGGLAGTVGLAVKPERRSVKLNDRRVGPELCGLENALDALIETQQTRGKVARRRDGSWVTGGHIEAAGVFHRATLSARQVAMQNGSTSSSKCRLTLEDSKADAPSALAMRVDSNRRRRLVAHEYRLQQV